MGFHAAEAPVCSIKSALASAQPAGKGKGPMERIVVYICGLWFWVTRRWRVYAYSEAAATLELAHAYLLRDFFNRASTRDRGLLLPFHHEALAILQNHAIDTYVAATRMANLRECCQFVSEELRAEELRSRKQREAALRPIAATPRPAPVMLRPAAAASSIRLRLTPTRLLRFSLPATARISSFARFIAAESSGSIWDRKPIGSWRLRSADDSVLNAEPTDQPLKAA